MELTFALGALSRSCGPERDIVNWILGGNTDLNNLTLLCRYHHTPFLQKRLDLPHQYRRATRMDTTPLDRPKPTLPKPLMVTYQ
jgi:hypothetical protein